MLILKKILLFSFCITLLSCTEKVTSYTPVEGEVQWIFLDKDSTRGVTFFVRVPKDTLAAIASVEINTKLVELGYYKSIDISFVGLAQETNHVDVRLTDENQYERFEFTGSDWESAIRQLKAIENGKDTLSVVLTCERSYKLSSFPAKLQINYRIVTQDTVVTGIKSFKAEETEIKRVMHWH